MQTPSGCLVISAFQIPGPPRQFFQVIQNKKIYTLKGFILYWSHTLKYFSRFSIVEKIIRLKTIQEPLKGNLLEHRKVHNSGFLWASPMIQ